MICPKCGKNMTNTDETKAYCMKCDVLIHLPSGVALTGNPEEDKFIGSPAVWFGEKKKNIEATAASDSLILTWKEGKTFGQKKLPYATITDIQLGKRKESEVVSLGEGLIVGGIIGVAMSEMNDVPTLIVKTEEGDHELYLSQSTEWAARLQGQMATTRTQTEATLPLASRTEPARTSGKAQPVPPTKFCRFCRAKIPRESKFCEECGKALAQ
jgi:hypothetical protein